MPKSPKKALKLSAEVDIHAVSCPGVWLPGRGRLSLSLCLLGFHTRTGRLAPIFPVMFHEKFKFDRTFVGVTNLSVLERVLETETVYLELMQEEASSETVLAVFESSVRDLLFPRQAERLSYSGNDLDLLMEPTRDFPGIISPKIEVSTKTVVGETRTPLHQCSQDSVSFGHADNKPTKATYQQPNLGEEVPSKLAGDTNEQEESEPKSKSVAFEDGKRYEKSLDSDCFKPPFTYKKPERALLSNLPDSPKRPNKYLGIKSRYLSQSTGNLSDLTKTSMSSRWGPNYPKSFRKSRYKDEDSHDAKVTLIEPDLPDFGTPSRLSNHPSPTRRPSSAPAVRYDDPSGISEDDADGDEEKEETGKKGNEELTQGRKRRGKFKKRLGFQRSWNKSTSRSPSPPPSHASAPPALARSRYIDSDDDVPDPLYFYRRYPYCKDYPHYDYDCPLCEPVSPRWQRHYRTTVRDPEWYYYGSRLPECPDYYYHSKDSCPICYKYNLYKPYLYNRYTPRSEYRYYPWYRYRYPYLGFSRYRGGYADAHHSLSDFDDERRCSKPKSKFGRKRADNYESADEIMSDVYSSGSDRETKEKTRERKE